MIMLILFSLSGYKLPHYLVALLPFASLFCASFIAEKSGNTIWEKIIWTIQIITITLAFLALACMVAWAFPITNILMITLSILLLVLVFYFYKSEMYSRTQRSVAASVSVVLLGFFLLNTNFYPMLLKYQGGNELAFAVRKKINAANIYAWKDMQSSSFFFYMQSMRKQFTDSIVSNGKSCWLLFDTKDEKDILAAGYKTGLRYEAKDYEITRLNLKFLNPDTRDAQCGRMVLAEVTK
jgi:hypothetical protein